MNDNFFNEFVLSVVIDRKYLSEEQLEFLEQEPIEYEIEDPFWYLYNFELSEKNWTIDNRIKTFQKVIPII